MWFFLSLLLICLTIIALFRMYLDLRVHQNQHNRLVQSDIRSYDKYKSITQQEAIENVSQMIRAMESRGHALPSARPYPSLDNRDAEYLKNDYQLFMQREREKMRRERNRY